jgi:predicted N-acetyltransferase YhbS
MITWAEDHIAVPGNDDGKRVLHFSVFEYDSLRRRLLESLGYDKTSRSVKLYRMRFGNRLLPCPNMPKGFVLRTTCANDQGDCEKLADVLNAAFNRNFHTAKEIQTFVAMSPSHRHDLELAAEERSGSSIAFVGVTYDEANRIGIFEPVGTHPDHRRKGLTRTLMLEGMKRLAALGATDAYVGTGDAVPANRLYEAVGFTEVYEGHIWRKVF